MNYQLRTIRLSLRRAADRSIADGVTEGQDRVSKTNCNVDSPLSICGKPARAVVEAKPTKSGWSISAQ